MPASRIGVAVRAAVSSDARLILELINELAAYERLEDAVDATEDMVWAAFFGDAPRVFCDIAEANGEAAGLAIWFYSFSTFRGRHGIYLEDLFVRPEMRGYGLGKALLATLAKRCLAENLPQLEWSVLDWNTPSIDFYRAQGADLLDGWTTCRVTGNALVALGSRGC